MGSDWWFPRTYQSNRVSIHAPAWGATQACDKNTHHRRFNPRSRMGSDALASKCRWQMRCFNPRSRMGSDCAPKLLSPKRLVSIHAPAWGATLRWLSRTRRPTFQSTLPHGERRHHTVRRLPSQEFQSTLPHGERRNRTFTLQRSIRFQSTLPHGERLELTAKTGTVRLFQSTLPHGERPMVQCIS